MLRRTRASSSAKMKTLRLTIRSRVTGSRRSWPETSCRIRVEILEDQRQQKREQPREEGGDGRRAGLSSLSEVGWPALEDHGQRHLAISVSKFLKIGGGRIGRNQGEDGKDGRRVRLSSSSKVGWLALEDHGQRHLVVSVSKFLKTSYGGRGSVQGEEGGVELLIRGRVAGSRRSQALKDHGQRHLAISMSKFLKTGDGGRRSDQWEEGRVELLIQGRVAGSQRSLPETSCRIGVKILEDRWRSDQGEEGWDGRRVAAEEGATKGRRAGMGGG